jgi:hypothetical protein
VSAAQARHVSVATLHVGVVPLQVAFVVHATHVALVASQAGTEPVHSDLFVAEHAPHDPLAWHAGSEPLQSPSEAQARHVCVPGSHAGLAPEQSALMTHATHVALVGLQTGVAAPQRVVFAGEHTPHAPEVSQAGVPPPHSPSPVHARHVCVVVLHTGVAPEQVAFVVHVTQVPLVVSHAGVAPVQSATFVVEHWPHAPEASHAGVVPPHSPSPPQARQERVVVLHTGVVPRQSVLVLQPTHAPVPTLHTEFGPVHFVVLVAEQTPHAPVGSHAGVLPPHSPSPAHPRHVWVVPLHTGALPPQSALPTQPTHVPDAVRQTDVTPPQAVVLVVEHWPHAPEASHAGVVPPHSPSPAHARHVCVVPLQMGAAPLQSAFAVQRTQIPATASHTGVPPWQLVAFVAEH